MANKHIYLGKDFAKTISFTPKPQGSASKTLPIRNIAEHAALLRKKYSESILAAEKKLTHA